MPSLNLSLRHIHLRKRKYHRNLKKFPNKNPKIEKLDRTMLIVGTIAPFFTLPQIINIYLTRDTTGLAWPTYFLLGSTNVLWLIYAIIHKDKPLIHASTLFILSNSAILLGIILF